VSERKPRPRTKFLRGAVLGALFGAVGASGALVFVATSDGGASRVAELRELRMRAEHRALSEGERLPVVDLCHPPERSDRREVTLEPALGGAAFRKPTDVVLHPSEPDTWFIAEHRGVVLRYSSAGEVSVFVDLTDRVKTGSQWGLQAIAFDPDFDRTGRVFLAYTGSAPGAHERSLVSRVSAFRSLDGGGTLDAESERVLLSDTQSVPWHPVASIRFGPDGLLYVSIGSNEEPLAQDPASLRGKLLRIDVNPADGGPYGVPEDNPGVGGDGRPEVYASGMRNPWRFSFDEQTGDLWLGDVGNREYEEVHRVAPGANLGWPWFEGPSCTSDRCGEVTHSPPHVAHSGAEVCSVTGGFVYRGEGVPGLQGHYVYADWCTGSLWAFDAAAEAPTPRLVSPGGAAAGIGSFARDASGELLVVQTSPDDNGEARDRVFRVVAAPAPANLEPDGRSLAELGCVPGDGPGAVPWGMFGYTIRSPAWAEGATTTYAATRRFEALYGGLETPRALTGSWFLKTFTVDGAPVETQMLVRRGDGTWTGHTWAWDDAGGDARPVHAEEVRELPGGGTWRYSPETCFECHGGGAGALLGLTLPQLDLRWQGKGGDQLRGLIQDRTLKFRRPQSVEPLENWRHDWLPDEVRAKAWLHVNCAHCHEPGGVAGHLEMDLRLSTDVAAMGLCDVLPASSVGDDPLRRVAPGAPSASLLSQRIRATGPPAMPPGRVTVDERGAEVVDAWIRSLADCD